MRKKLLALHSISFLLCLNSLASYDLCKDILRDGVRDTIRTHDTVDKKLASHNQFCSISKENNLNENNFNIFAKEYAKAVKSSDNSYGGSGGASYGPFSFNANYGQTNNKQDLSLEEKEDLLNKNSKQIIEYYNKNCGQSSFEDLLKTEAVLLSKIANNNIVQAWRECMLNSAGFFVDLMSSPIIGDEKEIEYHLMVLWKSNEGTNITSIELRYLQDKVSGPYQTLSESSGYLKTKNLCDTENCILISGSSMPLSLKHKDTGNSATITIMAKTNTGMLKSHVLILPKLVVPKPPKLENTTPKIENTPHIIQTRYNDHEMRSMMENRNLGEIHQNPIHSDNFMRNLMENLDN